MTESYAYSKEIQAKLVHVLSVYSYFIFTCSPAHAILSQQGVGIILEHSSPESNLMNMPQ